MELLDVYNANGKKTGEVVERGTPKSMFKEGERIAVAIIYIENSQNEFLIQKTSAQKGGHYSSTGGHVWHDEEPIETIKREVKEELGIDINHDNIISLGPLVFDFPVRFLFYLKKDIDLKDIVLQKEEVESVSYMSIEKLNEIIKNGLMHEAHAKVLERIIEYKKESEANNHEARV